MCTLSVIRPRPFLRQFLISACFHNVIFCNMWVTLNGPVTEVASLAKALTSAMFEDRLITEVNFQSDPEQSFLWSLCTSSWKNSVATCPLHSFPLTVASD